ncbi:CHAT domain-containing protein [Erythrobacter insulae]|uniref:CHAT domain-containing protein n=1 Tax=Erythrobacter insulae TaxID=2584124 RepID=A0A547PA69_9SPHN|nr:CHAT domain-containing protein [Erythrobacter insulae]TRD11040.1 CHAT domain-containing protein [Erythrobacter insulae]
MFPDPLRINYLVVLGDDTLEDASPFQGFGESWPEMIWALDLLASLPADVLEPSHPLEGVIAQRMGGMRHLLWSPLSISPLERLTQADLGLFVVVFSGEATITSRVACWAATFGKSILHVSSDGGGGSIAVGKFDLKVLKAYCETIMEERGDELSSARRDAVTAALPDWKEPAPETIAMKAWAHNITLPNHMVLARAQLKPSEPEPFIGSSEAEYTRVIGESVREVEALRERIGVRDFHRMSLLHPPLFLVEPALYRHAYARVRPSSNSSGAAFSALRILQRQKRLHNEVEEKLGQAIIDSPEAQRVFAVRRKDLAVFTAAVGLRAAQTTSSVMRLSPGVNHVYQRLGNFARNVRATSPAARIKTPRLFAGVQSELLEAVGSERIDLIEEIGGALKIVSDAPVEWLPVRHLPLMLRYQCSRICATPGNVLLGQLATSEPITLRPEDINRVLVVSSFEPDDPLRNLLIGSIGAVTQGLESKIELRFETVSSRSELIDALNASDASILIFDGHGNGNSETGVATLRIGKEDVDVWQLRGEARIPPVVILSACDTHGVDTTSHATVGNGLLAAGALTVLATLLPVDGRASASFIARLIYRLADFIPAALSARKRALNWTEIIAGMQQMTLASEILDALVGSIVDETTPRAALQTEVNLHINTGNSEWFEWLLSQIADHRGETLAKVISRAQAVIARSEAIRYVQLGNSENILIDDGSIAAQFYPPELRELVENGMTRKSD